MQLSLFGLGAAATKSVRTSVEISLDSAPADYTPVYPAYGLRQAALFVLMKYGENAVLSQLVAMIDCLPSNEYLLALSTMQYKIFERYGLIHGVRLIRFAVSTSGISEVVQFDDPQIQACDCVINWANRRRRSSGFAAEGMCQVERTAASCRSAGGRAPCDGDTEDLPVSIK